MRRLLFSICAALSLLVTACGGGSSPSSSPSSAANLSTCVPTPSPSPDLGAHPQLQATFVRFPNNATLTVEMADTPQERSVGLMNRACLAPDAGMIFEWPGEGDVTEAFWMENTYVPLSIAFLSDGGAVVDIQDMQPLTTNNHVSAQPYHFAVEANQGWFAAHGVVVGTLGYIQTVDR